MPKANVFDKFVRVRPTSGRSVNQKEVTVAANTTIRYGDLVRLNSGVLEQAFAANSTANGAQAYGNATIYGVALADIVTGASGEATTGRTKIPVAVLDDNCEVALRFWNATAGDSELQDVTLGEEYEPMRWTSNPNTITWYGMSVTTTNGSFRLVEKSPDSAAADDYGIAWFRLIDAYRQA